MKHLKTFESFVYESSKSTAKFVTIMVGIHKDGHNVISVSYWDEERHVKDYMKSPKERDELVKVQVNPKEADKKIKELQKEYNVSDKDVFHHD